MSASARTANLIEVFSAIQGEGIDVGTRQIFIRFAGCDLRCNFCDSAHTWGVPPTCRVEHTPGQRDFATHPNPVERHILLYWIDEQNVPGLHDSISLTGGEPLLHAEFLREFLPDLRDRTGLPVYLETGGHRPQELATLLPWLDAIGLDLKLPSVSGEEHWEAHAACLDLCRDTPIALFTKLIISDATDPTDLDRAAAAIAAVSPEIPAILQPVTPLTQPHVGSPVVPPTPAQVLDWQALLKRSLKHVRVVPQTHKAIAQL